MNKYKKLLPVGVSLAVGFLVLFIARAGLFRGFDYLLQDLLLPAWGASPDVVIIAIDDASISQIGQWPWPRAEYAKLLNTLAANPPQALGIDVLLAEPSRLGPADDTALSRALMQLNFPVVLASEGEQVKPLAEFASSPRVSLGDVHLIVDPDGVVRRASVTGSFAELLAVRPLSSGLTAGSTRIAYAGAPGSFRRLSFARVLADPAVRAELAGKIVLVGATATNLHDEQHTPLNRAQAMPGVEIQANIVNMLRSGKFTREFSSALVALSILVAALLSAVSFLFFVSLARALIASALLCFASLVAVIILFDQGFALPVIYPGLCYLLTVGALVLERYFGAERGRRQLRQLFAKYVSAEVLAEILRQPAEVKLGGEECEVTVLFADVRGFTTLSETMPAPELTTFLNRYLSLMTDIILAHAGVVDKYIGDAIMAFWGAPIRRASHARDGLSAAVAMSEALPGFNRESRELGQPEIEIGIGLNSGLAVAGNMGSRERFDYTLLGDTVNLASRLEGLTKYYGVRLIASAATVASCPVAERERLGIGLRELDQVRVKGKRGGGRVFEVQGQTAAARLAPVQKDFDAARELYYGGDFNRAVQKFEIVLTKLPGDGPTKLLLERSLHFLTNPPEDWQGVFDHASK